MFPRKIFVFLLSVALGSQTFAAKVIAPGAILKKVADDFSFTEGPACDAAGTLFFTDQPNDRILKLGLDGKLSTFLSPSGRSNGLCFDAKGSLIACADERNELWSISPDGGVTVLLKNHEGILFNGPNDVWVAPDGALYFTDPYYKRDYWKRDQPKTEERVFRLSPDRKTLLCVAEGLVQPNGITGTPDGRHLYVADIGAKKTYVYTIREDGRLADKTLFCELGSDGMTIDSEGNLYLTGRGVTVFDKTGCQIEKIEVPEPWTANVCIGGADRQTLFITASKGLYSISLRTKAANPSK